LIVFLYTVLQFRHKIDWHLVKIVVDSRRDKNMWGGYDKCWRQELF
jgi:hypothetical protein